MTTKLIHQIETYVVYYFKEHPRPDLTYHSLAHTQGVVKAAEQLVRHYKLKETEELVVLAATWFHDVGYLSGSPENHEERSADLAASYLMELHVSSELIEQVKGCILATRLPQSPTNRLEEIVCDADMFHLASDEYTNKSSCEKRRRALRGSLFRVATGGSRTLPSSNRTPILPNSPGTFWKKAAPVIFVG
ncbi:HD domain-containing protein [Spirosoma aerophilum]